MFIKSKYFYNKNKQATLAYLNGRRGWKNYDMLTMYHI